MQRNMLEDIKPLTKKNTRAPRIESKEEEYSYEAEESGSSGRTTFRPTDFDDTDHAPRRPGMRLWIITGGSIVLLLFVLSIFFSGADVTLTPKNEIDSVHETVTAYKNPAEGKLQFEIMSVDGEEHTTIDATKEDTVLQKASGTVTIFNNYSYATQKLVATTRLESKDGKIYRITKDVTVPGQSIVSGKTVAGTIDVAVVADQPGESYNLATGDLTIPGLKSSPKYAKFSAKIKTAITGGASGKMLVGDASVVSKAKDDLAKKLVETLTTQAFSQIPKGYLSYDEGKIFVISPEGVTQTSAENKITLTEKGTLYVYLFPEKTYADYILGLVLKDKKDGHESIVNMHEVKIIPSALGSSDPSKEAELDLKIDGDPKIIWDIDQTKVVDALKGKTKKEFGTIMASFVEVDKAELSISPFWVRAIPKNGRDIIIKMKNPFQ